jgi:hypothetical protein
MTKIPKYVRKLVGDDVALEDKHGVAHALTLRLQPSPTTVRADDEQVGQCVWPYCSGYGETSIRKGHVVAEVNWSSGRAWVHAYHLEQLGVRFARQRRIVAVSTRSMPRLSGGDSDQRRRFCVSALGGHLRLSWCS